jgi:predicted MPP superfamily phosphohydrolase
MRLRKWLISINVLLLVILAAIHLLVYTSFHKTPDKVTVKYMTVRSSTIPDSLDQVSALWLSDIEYGGRVDFYQDVFDTAASLHPDILFLGGDLFSKSVYANDVLTQQMIEYLSDIDAPLGKFAVLGEQDTISEERLETVEYVYSQSDVELLDNTSTVITSGSAAGMQLAGAGLEPDFSAILAPLNDTTYTFLLMHQPDSLAEISTENVDYALCGNAHGTQILYPFYGGYKIFPGSSTINRGSEPNLGFDYYISSGIGCIDIEARFNSPVELVYITFVKE